MAKSEIERLLAKYPNPRDVRYAPQLEGRGNELREQFPGTYGAIGGFLGTAPDEFERGSVLSDKDSKRDAAVRAGAEFGYPLGLGTEATPLGAGIGKLAAKYGPAMARNAAAPAQLSKQAGVIKAPGGNWLSGSVEDALKGLRRQEPYGGALPERIQEFNYTPEEAINVYASGAPDRALNSWIDKQLTRYVKNDMATERDPVRALAERGVLHVDPEELSSGVDKATQLTRLEFGSPSEGVGVSASARGWEGASDTAIMNDKASAWLNTVNHENLVKANPWLQKLPPEAPVNKMDYGSAGNLGFNHLIDELRNATNPQSGLPADLLLKYDALDKVSVPQAVERVAQINAWRAAQKAEADMARANNAATVLHKEYPEAGMKWVELRRDAPSYDKASPDTKAMWDDFRKQGIPEDEISAHFASDDSYADPLRDALKYEGDTMGHCVGGYCDDVASGATKIYSLRDAKGRPHVTVEVKPSDWFTEMSNRSLDESKTFNAQFKAKLAEAGLDPKGRGPEATQLGNAVYADLFGSPPSPNIIQIKGKGNKKPNDEYLPFVQDFVKSGKWSDVGDLQNSGLQKADWQADTLAEFKRLGIDAPTYGTADEINKALNALNKAKGFAKGGRVTAPKAHPCGCEKGYAEGGFVQYDPVAIDNLVSQLRAEFA